jgi:putative transposase
MYERHSCALRVGRFSEPQRIYLITTVTVARRALFDELQAGRSVVHALRFAAESGWAETLCYVVMPDHLHWMLQLGPRRRLSAVVGSIKSFSARTVNRLTAKQGAVWQPGFHDRALRKEEDLRSVARYVVANPVRAGLVRSVRDYPLWDAVWM